MFIVKYIVHGMFIMSKYYSVTLKSIRRKLL